MLLLCKKNPPLRRVIHPRRSLRRIRLPYCSCGKLAMPKTGICKTCYLADWHSEKYFGGNRQAARERDGNRCRGCNGTAYINTHHRTPGENATEKLLTLCASCHAIIHRTKFWRRCGLPPVLRDLWRELHPSAPLQYELPLAS